MLSQKLKRFLPTALFILTFVSPFSLKSSHAIGGSIYWDCLGNGDYQFHMIIYSDCNSLGAHNPDLNGPFGVIPMFLDSSQTTQINTACNASCLQKRFHYYSQAVTLTGTPPANGWEFYWEECCRDFAENLTASSQLFFSVKMYPYQPPGSSSPVSADSCFSSSPRFLVQNSMIHCEGPYSFNPLPFDPDGDQMKMRFAIPRAGAQANVSFSSGYSFDKPYPDTSEDTANGPVVLDSLSGEIELEFYNANPGAYYGTIIAEESRNGQKIAEAIYDVPLVVLNSAICAPAAANNRPNLAISSNNNVSVQTLGSTHIVSLMSEDTLDLNILASDFDVNANGSPQSFCLSALSNQINQSNYALDTGCSSPRCATIVPTGGQSTYCGTFARSFNFKWVPDCRMINYQPFSPLTYQFQIKVEDSGCPFPKFKEATILVNLYPGPALAPSLSIVSSDSSGNVSLSWTKVQIPAASPFDKYVIFQRALGGSFSPLDSISDIDSLQASYSGLTMPSQFFIVAYAGTCRFGSPSSAVVTTPLDVGLKEFSLQTDFEIGPNPAKDYLLIKHLGKQKYRSLSLRIFNSQGQLLKQQDLDPKQSEWRLELLQGTGVYIVELRSANTLLRTRILIQE